jgi:hypothetical protein
MGIFENQIFLRLKKKIGLERKILVAFLLVLSILYCYFATLPKYGDFWGLILFSRGFAAGNYDVYKVIVSIFGPDAINQVQPPAYMILEGIWIKFGAILFNWNLGINWIYANLSSHPPEGFPIWGMIPYLFALFLLVILTFITVKNKWLALIWFGPVTFVSMIIIGNSDIFVSLLIFVSLIFALKGFQEENFFKFQLISLVFLGLSMWFKTFGGLLFPVYFLCFTYILSKKTPLFNFKFLTNVILYPLIFIGTALIIWIPYYQYFLAVNMSRASILWGSTISIFFLNNISIWLIGFLVIIYSLFRILVYKSDTIKRIKNIFILYVFISFSWMFMSVYTQTQWWLILIPSIILILDYNEDILNYILYCCFAIIYLLNPLKWATILTPPIDFYYPVQLINKFAPTNLFVIVDSLIFSLLLIWVIDLLKNNISEESKRILINSRFSIFLLCLPICVLFLLLIVNKVPVA